MSAKEMNDLVNQILEKRLTSIDCLKLSRSLLRESQVQDDCPVVVNEMFEKFQSLIEQEEKWNRTGEDLFGKPTRSLQQVNDALTPTDDMDDSDFSYDLWVDQGIQAGGL